MVEKEDVLMGTTYFDRDWPCLGLTTHSTFHRLLFNGDYAWSICCRQLQTARVAGPPASTCKVQKPPATQDQLHSKMCRVEIEGSNT
jgi:hypothetical protein